MYHFLPWNIHTSTYVYTSTDHSSQTLANQKSNTLLRVYFSLHIRVHMCVYISISTHIWDVGLHLHLSLAVLTNRRKHEPRRVTRCCMSDLPCFIIILRNVSRSSAKHAQSDVARTCRVLQSVAVCCSVIHTHTRTRTYTHTHTHKHTSDFARTVAARGSPWIRASSPKAPPLVYSATLISGDPVCVHIIYKMRTCICIFIHIPLCIYSYILFHPPFFSPVCLWSL